jgi:hypothetical protein
MVLGEILPPSKFGKLMRSPYVYDFYDYDKNPGDLRQGGYYSLKPGAPPEIVKLNKELKEWWDEFNKKHAEDFKKGILF